MINFKTQRFKLSDVTNWRDGIDCTITALAAISSVNPNELALLLQTIALENGRRIPKEPQECYRIEDALEAVRRLGGDLVVLSYLDRDFSRTIIIPIAFSPVFSAPLSRKTTGILPRSTDYAQAIIAKHRSDHIQRLVLLEGGQPLL